MKNILKGITGIFSIIALVAVTAIPAFANHNDSETYRANLRILNNSGVHGKAHLSLDGDKLTVTINARGYEANMLHPQHIHGFADKHNSTCPNMSDDVNNDGVVDLGEGLPDYGPVLLSLEPFPTADSNGNVNFQNTYTVNINDLGPLENRAIVLHGKTVNGTYEPTLPVACGQIVMTHQGQNNGNGGNDDGTSNNGGSNIVIHGNGTESRNSIDVRIRKAVRFFQNNDTRILNDIDVNSNTGGNRTSANTGGDVSIDSGNSSQSIRIHNTAGFNIIGR